MATALGTVREGIFDKFTNIIDVYINCLQKKADKRADNKLIHTVRVSVIS